MINLSGREKESLLIKQANQASAVGRLMLGQFMDWNEFLEAECLDLINLPRRQLKSGKADVKKRLSASIKSFCSGNFKDMDERKLCRMYEEIKAKRGLELPLLEFEERFATLQPKVLKGNPSHLTVSISLWGLQFKIPEDLLAKDVVEAVKIASTAKSKLRAFKNSSHSEIHEKRNEIQDLIRQELFGSRSAVIACFNLMEAYLNGLAWDFLRTQKTDSLSNRQKKLLDDSASTSIRDKLLKYPDIIAGTNLWKNEDDEYQRFIDIVKPFRDSLVHPSPFNAPEKFGGYDKLRLLYRIDTEIAEMAASLTACLIKRIHRHVKGSSEPFPDWFLEISSKFSQGNDEQLTSE